jgi:nitroreductase
MLKYLDLTTIKKKSLITMTNEIETLRKIINERRSVRLFDANQSISFEVVKEALSLAQLAPNSSNLQLWEFYHITNSELKKDLAAACLGQKAATSADSLVVFIVRPDFWRKHATLNYQHLTSLSQDEKAKKMVKNYYTKIIPFLYRQDPLGIMTLIRRISSLLLGLKGGPIFRQISATDMRIVAHKSCALAAENFMLAMKASGYDTCPMEGFDSKRVKQLLKLPRKAEINMVIGCGVGKKEGIYGERYRVDFESIYHRL